MSSWPPEAPRPGTAPAQPRLGACEACLRRSWIISRLAANLDRLGGRVEAVLALEDLELIEAVAGAQRDALIRERAEFDPAAARRDVLAAGLNAVCRCPGSTYPDRLRGLANAPAVLYVAGVFDRLSELGGADPVAVIGARRASGYGLEVATALGRELGVAGVPVVSGLAFGIDAAGHRGALAAEGLTVAVIPGGAEAPYPRSHRGLHNSICQRGLVVSEFPPGARVWRWALPARNRIIAGLASMTVVVEAEERSGALITARIARSLGRTVGAVPGRVNSPFAEGPLGLLAGGARLVRGVGDVLDGLGLGGVGGAPGAGGPGAGGAGAGGAGAGGAGAGGRSLRGRGADRGGRATADVSAEAARLLKALSCSDDLGDAASAAGLDASAALSVLAELELEGLVVRATGGRYVVRP